NRAIARTLYSTAFFDARYVDDETVDELVKRGTNPPAKISARRAFTRFFAFCRRLAPFHDRLDALQIPVLVIWGSDDRLFRASETAVVRRLIPSAQVNVFERCGHCPQIEQPERLVASVSEFLAQP